MLRVTTILGLVLANLLLINCFPTVNVQKSFENGVLNNPDATDEGSNTRKNLLVELWPLGDFNGKTWFIGRTPVSYSQAVFDCGHLGIPLASANQAELNFLYSVTNNSDDFAWLGASVPKTLASFRWSSGGATPSDIPFYYDSALPGLALVLDRYPGNSGVRAESTTSNHFYICAY